MGLLDGRVAVITGAGRGIGREHALLFAREGAAVVVNDAGGGADGSGGDTGPAVAVVTEITAAGGTAVPNDADVSTWDGAASLVQAAVDAFGRLDVLVNNAGILRDRYLAQMSEADWDAVMAVHLKGHFAPLRHAAAYWKDRTKAGEQVRAAVVNTASPSGLHMVNPGQANYGAAKAGIAALTMVAAAELGRYGVRVNAIAPAARTRLTLQTPGLSDLMAEPTDPAAFDPWDPKHIAPLVACLAAADCPVTGEVFAVQSGQVVRMTGWRPGEELTPAGATPDLGALASRLATLS